MTAALEATVREVLATKGRLGRNPLALSLDDNLFDAGLTSQAAVEVVFGLEDTLGVEVPDSAITRLNLSTIGGIITMLSSADTST